MKFIFSMSSIHFYDLKFKENLSLSVYGWHHDLEVKNHASKQKEHIFCYICSVIMFIFSIKLGEVILKCISICFDYLLEIFFYLSFQSDKYPQNI